MPRESKTLAEVEEMLLDRLRAMPNGNLVEGVDIVPSSRPGGDPGVGVS